MNSWPTVLNLGVGGPAIKDPGAQDKTGDAMHRMQHKPTGNTDNLELFSLQINGYFSWPAIVAFSRRGRALSSIENQQGNTVLVYDEITLVFLHNELLAGCVGS